MSKNNRNRYNNNYNKMYEQKNDVEKTVDAAEEYNAEVVEEPEVTEEVSLEDSVEEEVVETQQTIGTVVDCAKLAVRKSPVSGAEMIATLDASTRVMVDIENSTVNYYKVYTEAGVEGYCVKDYIAVV